MTKIKLCGLSQGCDIEAVNALQPDYIGFVFSGKSRRYVPPEKAAALRRMLRPEIRAETSTADEILLDAGAGTGTAFDWTLLQGVDRRYFLAGGLNPENVRDAIRSVRPYGVDVSSGIETDFRKDQEKMAAFVAAVREENRQ